MHRGEPCKRHNRKIWKPCPVCGGRVRVGNRNTWWWVYCENDVYHIPQVLFHEPIDAIRWFQPRTNADRIRSMNDKELAHFIWNRDIDIVEKASVAAQFTFTVDREKCFKNVLDWLKEEVK